MTQYRLTRIPAILGLALALTGVAAAGLAYAQVARVDGYHGTLTNVADLEGTPIRIDLVRWSTDEDRAVVIDAIEGYDEGLVARAAWLEARAAEEAAAAAAEAAAAEAAEAAEAAGVEADGRGARGEAAGPGRGGRGGGRGGRGGDDDAEEESEPEPEPDPLRDYRTAMNEIDTAGVLWADTGAGYTIKYAFNEPLEGGGERVVLVTSTPLGSHRYRGWQTAAAPEDYLYSVIELRIPASGAGEGKTSLSTGVAIDAATGAIGLANYDQAPVHFTNVELAPSN
jgi:hypothetical protein